MCAIGVRVEGIVYDRDARWLAFYAESVFDLFDARYTDFDLLVSESQLLSHDYRGSQVREVISTHECGLQFDAPILSYDFEFCAAATKTYYYNTYEDPAIISVKMEDYNLDSSELTQV